MEKSIKETDEKGGGNMTIMENWKNIKTFH